MHINLETPSSSYFIRSYKPGEVVVNETLYHHSIIVHGNELILDWAPQTFTEFSTSNLFLLLERKPEVILLGTGIKQLFPEPALLQAIYRAGIGIEIMDTHAACRTYNILAAEQRNVLLAILLK